MGQAAAYFGKEIGDEWPGTDTSASEVRDQFIALVYLPDHLAYPGVGIGKSGCPGSCCIAIPCRLFRRQRQEFRFNSARHRTHGAGRTRGG
jgi:hypothetical protein